MDNIGLRIKEIRKENKLTQKAFGQKIGINDSAVSMVEKNERSISDAVFKNIISEFCVNELWLKDGIGEKYNEDLRKQKELADSDLNFMGTALMDRQLALLEKVQLFDEDERTEIIAALEEMYSILCIPELERNDYFEYYETVAGMLFELNRYLSVINDVKLSKDKIFNYIDSVRADLIKITKLFIPDLDDHTASVVCDNTNTLNIDENEIINIYRELDQKDQEEVIAFMNFKKSLKSNCKKKQKLSSYAHDEEAAAAQLKIG